jgi:membrane protease YdiL (CAAX protease family)
VDTTFQALQELEPPMWVRVVLVVAVVGMVASDFVVGRRDYRALRSALEANPADGETTRSRFLIRWARMSWAAAIAAVLLAWALPGADPGDLGLRGPDIGRLVPEGEGNTSMLAGVVVGALVALLGGLVAGTVALRSGSRRAAQPVGAMKNLQPMLPTGRRDRRAWALLSVTAGITEEITYRGLALLAVAVAVPANRLSTVVIVAVLFGLAHGYQGVGGVALTGLAGSALASIYLATGSLVPGMVLHALIDLRALLLRPQQPAQLTAPTTAETAAPTAPAALETTAPAAVETTAPPSIALSP